MHRLVIVLLLSTVFLSWNSAGSALAEPCDEAYKELKAVQENETELLARVQKFPDCGKLNVKLGDLYFNKKMWADAQKQYEKALTLFPDSKYVQNQLFETNKNIPITLQSGSKLDLGAEVARRGLGGTRKLPAIAVEVHFDQGSATVTTDDRAALDTFAAMVKDGFTQYSFEVQGHTDAVGSPQTNQTLSERRAQAVRDYLIKKHGLSADKLVVKGFGQTQPIASNETEDGRAKNRRVQFQGFQ